jgi:23S rRNA 5-hydroxycytidine C2501 synthase
MLIAPRKIELLSPAKNPECGIEAINHGADAVYIGASKFGARAAAGNSVADIEKLVSYAHKFNSKVFVALNTLLTDQQLAEAEKLINDVYEAGADALIVQDMGILKLNLPPIPLHASTQTDNRTPEKVKFLNEAGFSRVVLARELSLAQISEIHTKSNVELEAFVHGALCVSYSGQCYISQAMCGRSANRGECAQYCRLPYQLTDANGQILAKNKYLLSLKDLDLSDYLEDMIKAGIQSFKIEGRLKDINYVKNITSYYRKKLDAILQQDHRYKAASDGKTTFFFEPNPEKSFRRNATDYFLNGRHTAIYQPDTPKSLGEAVGNVNRVFRNYFEINATTQLNNGDGLCYISQDGSLKGFRVNTVEGNKIYPAEMPHLSSNIKLYRNQDQAFDKILSAKTSERKIDVDIKFNEIANGYQIEISDDSSHSISIDYIAEKITALKPETVHDSIRNQLSKLGNTIYKAHNITIQLEEPRFIQAGLLSEWRRNAIETFDEFRAANYIRELPAPRLKTEFPLQKLTYTGNVTNRNAQSFYREHGVSEIQPGFEIKAEPDVALMFTKHCIKYEMGWCPRENKDSKPAEPLYIKYQQQEFELKFDCKKCEMHIFRANR